MANTKNKENISSKDNKRQAVVIIHGIGEQRPMSTLRKFIEAVWLNDKTQTNGYAPVAYSSPDYISENTELRRLSTNTNKNGYITEFYEYYWAHLMEGNQLHHIWSWFKKLLFLNPFCLSTSINILRLIIILAFLGSLVFSYFLFNGYWNLPLYLDKLIPLVLTFIAIPWLTSTLNNVVGDAARYLDNSPRNVKSRHDIRVKGVELLMNLHKSNKFDRIIVVGHSLGSIIAYDILSFTFPKQRLPFEPDKKYMAIKKVANHALEGIKNIDDFQAAQYQAFKEQKAAGNPWLVSDLITIGSPLTHAKFLISKSHKEHERKIFDKELPSCPPVLQKGNFFHIKGARELHHASHFAFTRWTNIYFKPSLLVFGDIISGPISDIFGKGIKDIKSRFKNGLGLFTHTKYWTEGKNNEHIEILREALNLLDQNNQEELA